MAKDATKFDALPQCFVIMPISDGDDYAPGHFRRVYEGIFQPACIKAGYRPVRGDDVMQTNLIQLDILQRLVDSPMAICDLSSRNPNVLFELGLRQAFDKPTVLVQETGTPKIFDIAPLRYVEYRSQLRFDEVLHDQKAISETIVATQEAHEKGDGINSLVRLLSLAGPATLKAVADATPMDMLQILREEVKSIKEEIRGINKISKSTTLAEIFLHPEKTELQKIGNSLTKAEKAINAKKIQPAKYHLDQAKFLLEMIVSGGRYYSDEFQSELNRYSHHLNNLMKDFGQL